MLTTPRPIIDSVVRSVCGREVEGVVRLTSGGVNETYRVELRNDVAVVARIARQPVPWFADEEHVMAQARRVGVPTPEVLGVEQVDHDGWRGCGTVLAFADDRLARRPCTLTPWGVRHRSGYRHTPGTFSRHVNRIQMARSMAVSQRLAHLSFGKPHRGHVLRRREQLPVLRPSGQGQRTRGRARTGSREDGAHYHQVPQERGIPCKGDGQDEGRGEQEASGRPPGRKAWKGHLVEPATSLDQTQHSRENDAGDKSEGTEHEGKGGVGTTTGCQQKPQHNDHAGTAPGCCPGQSHPNGATDASPPRLHAYLPTLNRMRLRRAQDRMPSPLCNKVCLGQAVVKSAPYGV